ncbi:ribonuclease H-like domain-containing protein [Tanacetum coccineum]
MDDEPLAIPLDEIQIDEKLHFIEEPVEIMDREVKRLKQSCIPIFKVRWNSRRGPEFTWSVKIKCKRIDLPPNGKTVGSKWLFKKKIDMDGAVHTFKDLLVAKGFTQTYRVDYEETFSPVADIRAIRILIAIAAYYDYEIWQMDVKTAFLNGHLSEEVYMEQPEGFVNLKFPNRVCKLNHSIYELNKPLDQKRLRQNPMAVLMIGAGLEGSRGCPGSLVLGDKESRRVVISNSEDLISSLDLGNTLHLQNSDFNANTIISVKLTGTKNYRVWAATMKLAINTRNKTGFIDGSCVKSAYANNLFLGQNFSDNASEFLMGLNDVFQPIRSNLLSREILPDVKDAFAIVSREESHRGLTSSSFGSVTKPQVSSFVAKSNNWSNNGNKKADNNKRFGNSRNNRGPNLNLHCTNCKKVGHIVDRCFDIIGYPSGFVKNPGPKSTGPRTFNANSISSSNEKGASLSFTNEQMLKLMNLINDSPSGSV